MARRSFGSTDASQSTSSGISTVKSVAQTGTKAVQDGVKAVKSKAASVGNTIKNNEKVSQATTAVKNSKAYNKAGEIIKNSTTKSGNVNVAICIIVGVIFAILIFAVNVLMGNMYDDDNGALSPIDAAYMFVQSLDDHNTNCLKFLPPQVRDAGFKLEAMTVKPVLKLDKNKDLKATHIVVQSTQDISDKISALESGLYSIYNSGASISGAVRLVLSADFTYTPVEETAESTDTAATTTTAGQTEATSEATTAATTTAALSEGDISKAESPDGTKASASTDTAEEKPEVPKAKKLAVFNLISIKVGSKWYIYTGQQLSEDLNRTDADLVMLSDPLDKDISSYEIVSYGLQKIEKEVRPLDFGQSKSARKNLNKGYMTIDDKEYFIPTSYKSLMNLISLRLEAIRGSDAGLIPPNYVIKHAPFKFVNDDYSLTEFDINVANVTEANVNMEDGLVTSLYVGKPHINGYNYPDVYLPGDITFGTSYSDVVRMYGDLTEYEEPKTKQAIARDGLIKHMDAVTIYQQNIGTSKYNFAYFEFDSDNELVAFQYYFYDLSGITS